MICGEPLGPVMAKIHVDHIIPWKLVGDELNDNYQALCETCNECKSARTDYIFKALSVQLFYSKASYSCDMRS